MAQSDFEKLASKVTKEYEKRGLGAKAAKKAGQGVAGKVYQEQKAKQK